MDPGIHPTHPRRPRRPRNWRFWVASGPTSSRASHQDDVSMPRKLPQIINMQPPGAVDREFEYISFFPSSVALMRRTSATTLAQHDHHHQQQSTAKARTSLIIVALLSGSLQYYYYCNHYCINISITLLLFSLWPKKDVRHFHIFLILLVSLH